MTKPGCRMRIDRYLRNSAVSQPVSALHFQRRRSRLNPESFRQGGWNQARRDLLMDLHHALAEKILDQREDRAGMARQEPADRGEFRVDVHLGPADRRFALVGVAK